MRRLQLCLLLLLLAACSGDDLESYRYHRVQLSGTGLSVEIPDGGRVAETRWRADFHLYDFVLKDRSILGLYVGGDPAFHPAENAKQVEDETVGGMPAKTLVTRSGSAWSRDMLMERPGHLYYHFFYRNLRGTDLSLADHIIGSLQEGPPPQ
ncbi:MAG TPA: hypothetical protein VK433_11465 [Stellaceae bacterium]|nr:hypothetical protein [Stellaceae bacterium]